MVLMSIIFQNTIQGLWRHFFPNTKTSNSREFSLEFLSHETLRHRVIDRLLRSKAQQKVYRLLQPMTSSQQLLEWLLLIVIPKKFENFEFFFPRKNILESLPPPPRPPITIHLGWRAKFDWPHLKQTTPVLHQYHARIRSSATNFNLLTKVSCLVQKLLKNSNFSNFLGIKFKTNHSQNWFAFSISVTVYSSRCFWWIKV